LEFRGYLVYKLRYTQSKFRVRHLGFSTSGYLLISAYYQYNTKGMSLAGNVGDAVKNVLPPSVELKI